ncbi:hypothetical protein MTO98_02080 [Mucilaginibacter sp. SMC90]|uniref:hypothetical protein n=1 Tax=Mucilaginibacter TaxID=423349 RepID=UPI00131CA7C1|nr:MULTISPECIES: hypothetical protein [unclassified Mucilaginibacter]MBS7565680.1 hypothetical protein [Mucilaginibacter sp. Bleaf8]UOE49858.1 hypothetical protein MTO98_02080 [Mucilaginibacter sp. SMC90]
MALPAILHLTISGMFPRYGLASVLMTCREPTDRKQKLLACKKVFKSSAKGTKAELATEALNEGYNGGISWSQTKAGI